MRKKIVVYISLFIMMFSVTGLQASELESGLTELTIEDAIEKAQRKDDRLKTHKIDLELAQANEKIARQQYLGVEWSYRPDEVSAAYTKATANRRYQIKNEVVIKDQIAYEIENQFDAILELEEQSELAASRAKVQKEKTNQVIRKEKLGLASTIEVEAEKATLEIGKQEIKTLAQSLDIEYRKLNDAIGGSEQRYNLIKGNTYEPLDMIGSLEGRVSHAIDSDLGLWLQEQVTDADKTTFLAPGADGYAPTYELYQQRKVAYQKALNDVSLNKEGKKEQVKQIYENILMLELQHDKIVMEIEESKREYDIMKKRYELGMVTSLNLDQLELATLQKKIQLTSIIRQHNQLKEIFDKSYLRVV